MYGIQNSIQSKREYKKMEYEKVENYSGVYKKNVNGVVCYFARFKFKNKLYPFLNLTFKYGVRKPKEAFEKIQVLKSELRSGINPFLKEKNEEKTLGELWDLHLKKKKHELSENTIKSYSKFYKKWLEPSLKNKRVSEILESDLNSIFDKGLMECGSSNKNNLKKILSPFFRSAFKKGYIKQNILEDDLFKFKKQVKKIKVSKRTKLKHLEVAQKLYKTIDLYESQFKKQREELKVFFYLFLMTGHRYGELLQLEKENIIVEEEKIKVFNNITKTNIETYFPFPKECYEFFSKLEEGKVFKNIKYGAIYGIFKRLKEKANLDFELSAHEVRNLLLNSLISLKVDSSLVNRACLDHSIDEVFEAYLDIDFEQKKKIYEIYWENLRK